MLIDKRRIKECALKFNTRCDLVNAIPFDFVDINGKRQLVTGLEVFHVDGQHQTIIRNGETDDVSGTNAPAIGGIKQEWMVTTGPRMGGIRIEEHIAIGQNAVAILIAIDDELG